MSSGTVKINSYLLEESVKIGAPYNRKFEITNLSSEALAEGTLTLLGDSYHEISRIKTPRIPPNESVTVSLKCCVRGGVTIDDLPPMFEVEYVSSIKIKFRINTTMVDFVGRLKEIQASPTCGSEYINILLFGLAGATKSSFLNSIFTLLGKNQTEIITKTAIGGGSGHTTTVLRRHKLDEHLPGVKICLWDSWGLTGKTYGGGELEYLLKGKLPNNWKMDDRIDDKRDILAKGEVTQAERQIHGILFFFPQASLGDPNASTSRSLLTQNFQEMIRHEINPILLLTRVDEIDSKVRTAPLTSYPAIVQLKQKASTQLNVPIRQVLTNVNYISENKRSFEIDRLNYKILERVALDAKHNTEKANEENDYEW